MHYVDVTKLDPFAESGELDEKLKQFNRRLLVYVSGKYRDKSEYLVSKNIQVAADVAAKLWEFGYSVICPHKNTAFFGGAAPDDVWLEGDMAMVERSDIVVMLDNWATSEGAKLERRMAMKLGIPVYYWSIHRLALERLAANDYRHRDARAAILRRAGELSRITGWNPGGVYGDSAPAQQASNPCSNPRAERMDVQESGSLVDRLRRHLEACGITQIDTSFFGNRTFSGR